MSSDKKNVSIFYCFYRKFNERGKNRQQNFFGPIFEFCLNSTISVQHFEHLFPFFYTQTAHNDGTLLKSQSAAYASHLQ